MPDRKWLTPANIISLAGIGVAAAVGVAVGNPSGQEFMCGVNEFFCADVEPVNVQAWGETFDISGWCRENVYVPNQAPAETGEPEPPGMSPAVCYVDFGGASAQSHLKPLQAVYSGGDGLDLAVNLSFEYDPIRSPKLFSVRLQCGHMPPGEAQWTVTPCRFASTARAIDTFVSPSDLVERFDVVRDTLAPSPIFVFARRWGLEIDGNLDTYYMKPGRYRVTVKVADQPDRVARRDATFEFEVRDR
jgi:hypothetical protein